MKIPSTVRISKDVTYEVVYSDLIGDDYECVGYTDEKKRIIFILNGQTKIDTRKAFIHELSHAICLTYKIKVTHKVIYQLEEATYSLLKLNHWI